MSEKGTAHESADREMRPFDALLHRGENHPRTRSMLVATAVLAHAPERERLREQFERASRIALRLRQKVVVPTVPLVLPCWIVDPDFDLDHHLRFTRLRRGASYEELLGVVQHEVCARLDGDRPLWEAHLVEGLKGGAAALVIKMSHAIADGVGAQRLFEAIFSPRPEPPAEPMPPLPIPEDVTPEELTRSALGRNTLSLARAAVSAGRGLAGWAVAAAGDPAGRVAAARAYADSAARIMSPAVAPVAAFAQRGNHRRCVALDVPLAALRRAAHAADGSINDAYLAAVAGGVAAYLQERGVQAEAISAVVPVNLRRGGEDENEHGNNFGGISIALPLAGVTPRERIRLIHERMRSGRSEPALGLPHAIAPWVARMPEAVTDLLARRTTLPDVQISNVAGAPHAMYLCGARIEKLWPFGPVPGTAAMFTMHSLSGGCHVGVNLDPAAIVDPQGLANGLQHGFEEVLALAGGRVPRIARPWIGAEQAR